MKNSKKLINAWCSYDMANSAYSLCIATILYPIYFEGKTSAISENGMLHFLSMPIKNTVLYEFSTGIAYLLGVILVLLLSGFADIKGQRKSFLQGFTLLGGLSCIGMYWFTGSNLVWGLTTPMLAIIAFTGSFVFYNSFLPYVASPSNMDKVSARGYAFGYFGSMILLIFILIQVEYYAFFGFSSSENAVRTAFIEVGVWWMVVGQYALAHLKDMTPIVKHKSHLLKHGWQQSIEVFKAIRLRKHQNRFLWAFFFFSVGVQTVMILASLFGAVELKLDQSQLIMTILLVQITGIIGANLLSYLSKRLKPKQILIPMLILWLFICLSGFWLQTLSQFFVIAGLTGLVMAGVQAQSRAIWSSFIPKEKNHSAAYFSFFDSAERIALVLGMFYIGFIDSVFGGLRMGMISLSFFFIISLTLLYSTKIKRIVS